MLDTESGEPDVAVKIVDGLGAALLGKIRPDEVDTEKCAKLETLQILRKLHFWNSRIWTRFCVKIRASEQAKYLE
jgi:hypothetical protein